MSLTLILLAALSTLELLLWAPLVWRVRKAVVVLLIPTLAVLSGLAFGQRFELWAGLVLVLSMYRIINLLRILENHLQATQLYRVSRRTSRWLIGWQVAIVACAALSHHYSTDASQWLYGLAVVQLLAGLVLLASTNRHLRTTRPPALAESRADHDLPTLSVAIPARNETADLEACLQSLVTSDYPKLEVLVLDDCSQNKRTPEIIRGYAQSGVRFIAGKTPPKHWLAKNYAYQQLADEANGEILLFCGVDTRFQSGSLRAMVETMLDKDKQMMSLLPRNAQPSRWNTQSALIQPARYAWELALPRRLFRRPPMLSTCWLITHATLQAAGSFEATANSVSVESYFAKYAASHRDDYTFLQSDATIGLLSVKSPAEQRATAIRVRYPQLHRRPELVALFSLAELGLLAAPLALLIGGLLTLSWPLIAVPIATSILLTGFYSRIVALTYRQFLLRGLWLLPFAVIYDICLLNYSMWQYEFREVIWKDRNICLPLRHAPPDTLRS